MRICQECLRMKQVSAINIGCCSTLLFNQLVFWQRQHFFLMLFISLILPRRYGLEGAEEIKQKKKFQMHAGTGCVCRVQTFRSCAFYYHPSCVLIYSPRFHNDNPVFCNIILTRYILLVHAILKNRKKGNILKD